MAVSNFVIRCKTPKGNVTITNLTSDSSLKALKETVMNKTGINQEKMKILSGFPPKPLKLNHDNHKLCDAGINSSETLIIQIDDSQTVPDVTQSTSNSSSKKRKQELPEATNEVQELNNLDRFNMRGIMMRYDVPSNNSCLFSSIYFIVNDGFLDVSRSEELRHVIAEAVSRDPDKYTHGILGRENSEYCSWILNTSNWGGAIELTILSEHFQLEICAVDIMSCQIMRFGESYSRRGVVVYDGIHYDPLYMQQEDNLQTMFHVNETYVLESALEVAKEARSSKQFTDLVNFKLKCNECGQQLRGEKDASAHAKTTGHINFGELL